MNKRFQFRIAEKAVKDMRQVALGNPGTVIFDFNEYSFSLFRFYCNPYIGARCILNSIVE